MAHYDLYSSLGLDRSSRSSELADKLDAKLTELRAQGVSEGEARIQEAKTARSILGDEARRSTYDARLNDSSAPDIQIADLFSLAHSGSFGDGGAHSASSAESSSAESAATAHPYGAGDDSASGAHAATGQAGQSSQFPPSQPFNQTAGSPSGGDVQSGVTAGNPAAGSANAGNVNGGAPWGMAGAAPGQQNQQNGSWFGQSNPNMDQTSYAGSSNPGFVGTPTQSQQGFQSAPQNGGFSPNEGGHSSSQISSMLDGAKLNSLPGTAKGIIGVGLAHAIISLLAMLIGAIKMRDTLSDVSSFGSNLGSEFGLGFGFDLGEIISTITSPLVLTSLTAIALQALWGIYVMAVTFRPSGGFARLVAILVTVVFIVSDICMLIAGVSSLWVAVTLYLCLHVAALVLLCLPATIQWFARQDK